MPIWPYGKKTLRQNQLPKNTIYQNELQNRKPEEDYNN